MAIKSICQGAIIEVNFRLPGGDEKIHPALVISDPIEDGEYEGIDKKMYDKIFYVALISTKQYQPEYCIEINPEWIKGPSLDDKSYFVTHIITACRYDEIIGTRGSYLDEDIFDKVLDTILKNVFNVTFVDD